LNATSIVTIESEAGGPMGDGNIDTTLILALTLWPFGFLIALIYGCALFLHGPSAR
jgi:hypothetical protein